MRLCLLAFTLLLATALTAPATETPPPPNIVFILADDLGYGDVGCYNPSSKIPTPRLDRLASQGMRFTDAHAPAAVCTPSRYAILTGRYGFRSTLRSGVSPPWGPPLIAKDLPTVASMLQQAGYRTACIGKWHLGWQWPTKDGKPPQSGPDRLSNVDFTQAIAQGPTTHGFDRYFGVDLPNFPPYCFIDQDRTVGIPSLPNPPEFNRPGPVVEGWRREEILPAIIKESIRFIESSANKEPFFLYLPLTGPHYPVVPTPEFKGRTTIGEYGDFVAQIDHGIGDIIDALDRLKVRDNTLVIFTSDNGPEIAKEVDPGAYDRRRLFNHDSAGGWRGVKRDLWEGGHRVPFIASWPRRIPAGLVSDEVICHVDLFATAAGLVGKPVPDSAIDSVNISPVLLGEAYESPIRKLTVHQSSDVALAIRKGDWIYIDAATGDRNGRQPHGAEPEWIKKERGYVAHQFPGELFNLKDDPAQRFNRYEEKPELVRELKTLLREWVANDGTRR